MKKFLKIFGCVILCLFATLIGGAFIINIIFAICRSAGNPYPRIFGLASAIVVSESMEPTLKINDYIVSKTQNNYEVNDIIVFWQDDKVVTHRVKEITENGYITQGDNELTNPITDGEILKSNVFGKVVFCSSAVGNIKIFARTPLGIISVIIIMSSIIVITYFTYRPKNPVM